MSLSKTPLVDFGITAEEEAFYQRMRDRYDATGPRNSITMPHDHSDAQPAAPAATPADENARYRAEYAELKAAYPPMKCSEADYVHSRRIDDGVDQLQPLLPIRG